MIGFTYNGIHSSEYNCWFVPARNEWFGMETYEVSSEESVDDGGYYFGNRAGIRTQSMKCFVEDATMFQQRGILNWLSKDTSGDLITDDRPWVYYKVHPSKNVVLTQYTQRDNIKSRNLYCVTFTATFSAYEPYGVQYNKAYTKRLSEANYAETPNMLPVEKMPPLPQVDTRMFLLYNCGDVRTGLTLRVAGDVGGGIAFYNSTTKQQCKIHSLKPEHLRPGQYLEIDSSKGTARILGGDDIVMAYEYHEDGYINLKPNKLLASKVRISTTAGSPVVTSTSKVFTDAMVGAYIYVADRWLRIAQCTSPTSVMLIDPVEETASQVSMVATMNEIYVTSNGDYNLSMLEVDYLPKIR